MNKRKYFSLLLMILLLIVATACQGEKNTISSKNDVLTICMDITTDLEIADREMKDLLDSFTQVSGIENIELEYLPSPGAERETAIQRIRTEIMSGSGPDIFLVRCGSADYALFPYPEKAMDGGFFLPLDEYMENSTEYTEWDKLQQTVLDAGRNEEGQQIIPLNYTCPVQIHPKSELDLDKPDHLLTFEDILSDPALNSVYSDFYNCRNMRYENGTVSDGFSPGHLEYIIGKIADFKQEELLLSEEELLSIVKQIYALPKDENITDLSDEGEILFILPQFSQPFTMLPLYSTSGGVTVSVGSIAAINRNTQRPDEAYKFLDFFLQKKTQLTSHVYRGFSASGLPLHTDVYKENTGYTERSLKDETYMELADLQSQIAVVNFETELTMDLAKMMTECWRASEENRPMDDIVHKAYEQMQRKVRE